MAQCLDEAKSQTLKMLLSLWYVCSWRKHKTRTVYIYSQLPLSMIFPNKHAVYYSMLSNYGRSTAFSEFSFKESPIASSRYLIDGHWGGLTQAFTGTLGSRPPPRPIIEERKTLFTVHSISIMFAITHQLVKFILHTLACMPIAFTPGKRRVTQIHETATKS